MKLQNRLKTIAATTTVLGIIFAFFERWYSPDFILTEESPSYPDSLAWFGWIVASGGSLVYIVIDMVGSRGEKRLLPLGQNDKPGKSTDSTPTGTNSEIKA